MTRLQEQLEELELLESVFSGPGEFQIEDRLSHERAQAYLGQLTSDPPKNLSCRLVVPINAHQESDDEGSGDEDGPRAGAEPLISYSVTISVRLGTRWVGVWVLRVQC